MSKIQTFLQNILSARYGKDVRQSIHDAIEEIDSVADTAKDSATAKAEEARKSALSASNSATAAATSENNAKSYMESASTSAANAKTSETNSKTSETNAKASETNAKVSEENAQAVFESLPEDYNTLSDEFYEVAIKQAVTGEQIHVDDSANAKVREFALFGKATQKTTSGKNLLTYPYNETSMTRFGVTFTDLGDGTIHVNGTNTKEDGTAYLFLIGISDNYILPKGTYIISGTPIENNSDKKCWLSVTREIDSTRIASDTGSGGTFTLEEDTQLRIAIIINASATANNLIFKPMLRLASVEDDTWEPYTGGIPSPNPRYPQEIEVAGASGSVEVKSVGKNLYNRNSDINRTNVGVTATISEGVMVLNGTATGTGALPTGHTYTIIDAKIGDIITHSIKVIDGTAILPSNTSISFCRFLNEKATEIYKPRGIAASGTIDKNTKFPSKTFVVTENMFGSDGRLRVNNQTYFYKDFVYNNLKLAVQLEKSSVATEYQPYKETISTIPTPNGLARKSVSSGGSYTDSNGQQWICDEILKYADGSGEYVQRVTSAVFDGVNNKVVGLGTSQTYGTSFGSSQKEGNDFLNKLIPVSKNSTDIITDYFISKVVYYGNTDGIGSGIYRTKNAIWFSIDKQTLTKIGLSDTPTVDEFNAWLQENPVTVYGILAEPIITPLTAEQLAEIEKVCTFYPVTNISNDADCGMKVTYLADSKIYIDNQLSKQMDALREEMANTFALMSAETQAAMIENDTNNLLTESEE